jgi:hypothetical protein
MRCTYGIFSREITIHTVIYGVYIRFWPTLLIHQHETPTAGLLLQYFSARILQLGRQMAENQGVLEEGDEEGDQQEVEEEEEEEEEEEGGEQRMEGGRSGGGVSSFSPLVDMDATTPSPGKCPRCEVVIVHLLSCPRASEIWRYCSEL